MENGFIKVAAIAPPLKVADCAYNANEIVKSAWCASNEGAKLLVTPELGVTGYTCNDLFLQRRLLDDAALALKTICEETASLDMVLLVGLPMPHKGKLYNCAAVLSGGKLLGLVPKTHLPNYAEFQEQRWFSAAFKDVDYYNGPYFSNIPIGTKILFQCEQLPTLQFAAEICEDLWAPAPPSAAHAAAGALLVANLSAGNEVVGKMQYRRSLVEGQSARLCCGYLYANAGMGESTTDLVFSGHCILAENGVVLAENTLFSGDMALTEVDLERLAQERLRRTTWPAAEDDGYILSTFSLNVAQTTLTRPVSPTPFVPRESADLAERCELVLGIQARGLARRVEHTGAKTALLGVSGGLDSTLALLVTARAFALLGREPGCITAVTMPGFGTTNRTKGNAEALCAALGIQLRSIDISNSVASHFKDIGHDPADHDVVYENAQARMRTLVLMDLANQQNGLVVGTGDLSELALGWATYNGDHMSMYGVNASVPKTLIRHLVEYEASIKPALAKVLADILATPVSPELLPPENGVISQQTEELVGPYILHDFFLYYTLRWGFTPAKVLRLALCAFEGAFDRNTIVQWMGIFYRRFFAQQFKRSCLPDGPKVGSVSFSPRGDWRMPSDASAAAWLEEVLLLESPPEVGEEE